MTVYFCGPHFVRCHSLVWVCHTHAFELKRESLNIQRLCCIEDEEWKKGEMEGWSMMLLLLHQMPFFTLHCSKRVQRTPDSIGSSPCAFFFFGGGKGDKRVCSHSCTTRPFGNCVCALGGQSSQERVSPWPPPSSVQSKKTIVATSQALGIRRAR